MTTPHFDSLRVDALTVASMNAQPRTIIVQTPNAIFPVPWEAFRVFDAYATNLPGTAADDDLAIVGGTVGSAPPMIQAGDCKTLTVTRKARFCMVIPESFDDGQTVSVAFSAGMVTTVASTSVMLDLEAYQVNGDGTVGTDLCATAAQSINSLSFATKTFVITSTGLVAGDVLDCLVSIAVVDAATGTAVIPSIAKVDRLVDIVA